MNDPVSHAGPVAPALSIVYTHDRMPGIRRRRCGRGWAYYDPDGILIRDAAVRRRLNDLAIPPAYDDVWICPLPHGHLQATGRDARNRKQYRYHPEWHAWRARQKFAGVIEFGRALPEIRKASLNALRGEGLDKDRVLGAVVGLLDRTAVRVGNDAYRERNDTYGLTTLTAEHLELDGAAIQLAYIGKNSKQIEVSLRHPTIARMLRRLQDLPGQQLFQYRADGEYKDLDSSDVNAWLKQVSGGEFTARTFRTWHATRLAAEHLGVSPPPDDAQALASARLDGIRATAKQLHHRPAVCRAHYIHPKVLTAYADGRLFDIMQGEPRTRPGARWDLSASEIKLMALLTGDPPA